MISPMRTGLAALALAAVALLGAGSARADVYASYTVSIDAGLPAVTDIVIFEKFPPYSSSITWAFQAPGGATTTIDNPFPRPAPPTESFLVGIVNGLPGDGDLPVDHAVLFLGTDAASAILSQNLSFQSLFPGVAEADLIAATEGIARNASDSPEWAAGSAFFSTTFLPDLRALTIPDGHGGTVQGGTFVPPGGFTAVAFTDPTRIGSGTSALVGRPVPEPSAALLMGVGLGVLGLGLRRRRRTMDR